jgi:dienelactone hydrolase
VVKFYPGAHHAFFIDTWMDVYRPVEAKDAWTRVLSFFLKHLKS